MARGVRLTESARGVDEPEHLLEVMLARRS